MSIINWIRNLFNRKRKLQEDKYTTLIKQLNEAVNRPLGENLVYECE